MNALHAGEVAEWSKAPDSKSGIPETVSGVRIPSSPFFFLFHPKFEIRE